MYWVVALTAILVLSGCGSGEPTTTTGESSEARLSAVFSPGLLPYAAEARLDVPGLERFVAVTWSVHTMEGGKARPVRSRIARSWFETRGLIDPDNPVVRFPVFGLYATRDNRVSIQIEYEDSEPIVSDFAIPAAGPLPEADPEYETLVHDERLGTSYILVQTFDAIAVVDVDGQVRWRTPTVPTSTFPVMPVQDGFVAGSLFDASIVHLSWLGVATETRMSDARAIHSHHNLEQGKTGLLNTIGYQDGEILRPESVVAEMTPSGTITRMWDLDEIFRSEIQAAGEDPSLLVADGRDWFHMNSAVYDASDDSLILSSRENFVVKIDYATGDILWILGSLLKPWAQWFPNGLLPHALAVVGQPPVGQHALSVSADGARLMMFDNGKGGLTFPEAGETRTSSRVVVYEIDEPNRTASEAWSFDLPDGNFCPFRSSAYWTRDGSVLIHGSAPVSGTGDEILVVNSDQELLFRARHMGTRSFGYSARELPWDDLVWE